MITSREWRLRRRPEGRPVDADVELVTTQIGEPASGEVRVRNLVMSVDPYMRGRMSDVRSYVEPYALGAPMEGRAVGRVTASGTDVIAPGSLLLHDRGWREHALVDAEDCIVLAHAELAPSAYLGPLGNPGMTAWVGLRRVAMLQGGETLFVSSAAGAVGSTVVQIAKALGCTVIASAGSAAKVAWVRDELGADAVFDYHDGNAKGLLGEAMAHVGADGLDVYFDNVGGEQLEAAIRVLNDHAHVALCGMISVYNSVERVPGPSNLLKLIWRKARMEGFLVSDHEDARSDFEEEMLAWLRDGTVRNTTSPVEGGIEAAWHAFLLMLDGGSIGKAVVPLANQ